MLNKATILLLGWVVLVITAIFGIVLQEVYPSSNGVIFNFIVVLLISFLTLFFDEKLHSKIVSLTKKAAYLFVSLAVLHTTLNIVNIYDLVQKPEVRGFCLQFSSLCSISSELFFSFKIFRIITLSSDFFVSIGAVICGVLITRPIIKKINITSFYSSPTYQKLFISIISIQILLSGLHFVSSSYQDFSRSISATKVPYDDRYLVKMGGDLSLGWIYTYSKILRAIVPENATVFLPPQTGPWRMEGNMWFMRSFLYPRNLIAAQAIESMPPTEADYVLISHGAWLGETNYGWPKKTIPESEIKRIVFIDRDTQKITEIKNEDFVPDTFSERWGVIELK